MDYRDVTAVLPSLNPDKTLEEVVDSLLEAGFRDIILINDGSDEAHLAPFLNAAQRPEVTLLTHEVNRGKGAAMKTAFAWLLEHRPDCAGVVTVDGDGQHLAADVKNCAQRMVDEGDKVVLGCRNFNDPQVPWKSRTGNRITTTVFKLFCGLPITDTQTGLRAIPYRYLPLMCETAGERYEYETEMFFSLKKEKIGIAEEQIATVYEPGNPSSHFKPFRDAISIYRRIIAFSCGQALAFVLSSGASFLLDYGLFTILDLLIGGSVSRLTRLLLATFPARAVSSLFNYTVNRKAVFHSDAPVKRTLIRYYTLCVIQVTASFGLVFLLSTLLRAGATLEPILKLCVDLCLFLLSYQIQRRWVFG